MTSLSYRRVTALTVVLALALMIVPVPAFAGDPGVVVGRVLANDGVTPLRGVVVSLVDNHSQSVYESQPSTERGTFEAKAPAGDYRVVAATPKGAFLASNSVRVAAGANPPVSLTLKQAAAAEPTGSTPPATPPPSSASNPLPTWAKWVIVGGIVVTGALVVDAVTSDDNETPSSSFTPTGK